MLREVCVVDTSKGGTSIGRLVAGATLKVMSLHHWAELSLCLDACAG